MKKKYVCVSGHVVSMNDGERHYVPASRLPQLYGVDPSECVFVVYSPGKTYSVAEGMKILRPDPTGRYPHPDKQNGTETP